MEDFNFYMKNILRGMGISENAKSDFSLDIKFSAPEWKILEKEISINDEKFNVDDDGIFYKGRRVILYIRDQAQYYEDKVSEYKFHLTACSTLKSMLAQNRYEKYVVTENTSGVFKVNYIRQNDVVEAETRLHVCKNCLHKLNWKNYKNVSRVKRNIIYQNFSIEEFFASVNNDNQKNFDVQPEYTDATAPLNVYPPNWDKISKVIRTEAGYICEGCGRIFQDGRGLHVHHRNTIKSDCSRANLEVLCTACHQKKHNHKILGGKNF